MFRKIIKGLKQNFSIICKDYIDISEKYLRIWYQWLQGGHLSWSFTSANLDAVKQQLFQKSSTMVFFFIFVDFFRIYIKNNSWWIAQKILSKKVKQITQTRGGETEVAMELQKKPKWTITKTLL